ncbi:MAG: serine hydrolase [Pseudomonadota bacterium]
MRKVLKVFGWAIVGLLCIGGVALAMNWTLARNMVVTRGAGITDVELYTPRQVVQGCAGPKLEYYAENTPIPADVFAQMNAFSLEEGGAGLIVMVDGKVVGEAYRDGLDASTKTLSMSMHKSILGLVYGAALADGVIGSLDDRVGQYIEEWSDDPRGDIPLRAFLTMSSGLRNPSFIDDTWEAMTFNLSDKVTKTALTMQPRKKPFEEFWYKGIDSQIAGAALNRAIQAAGKGAYNDYLSEKIWCPIGAGDALLWSETKEGDPRFFAFLEATARDWARIGQMILDKGTFMGKNVLPESYIEAYKTPSQTNPNYGLQTWLSTPYLAERPYNPEGGLTVKQSAPHLAEDVLFFDGYGGQRVYVVPSAGLVIARTGDVNLQWDDAVLVNLALEALQNREGLGR